MRDLDEVARVAAPLVEKYRILLPIDCKCAEFDRAPGPEPTDRQLEVARLLFEGLTYKEVAERLGPTPSTSRRHMCKLRDRLGVETNEEAFLLLGQRRDLERT
jgi:DNA-binding NarL/FixJ family response regulator